MSEVFIISKYSACHELQNFICLILANVFIIDKQTNIKCVDFNYRPKPNDSGRISVPHSRTVPEAELPHNHMYS